MTACLSVADVAALSSSCFTSKLVEVLARVELVRGLRGLTEVGVALEAPEVGIVADESEEPLACLVDWLARWRLCLRLERRRFLGACASLVSS